MIGTGPLASAIPMGISLSFTAKDLLQLHRRRPRRLGFFCGTVHVPWSITPDKFLIPR